MSKYCINCGAELAAGVKFCVSCGTKLEAKKPVGKLKPSQEFCTNCGTKLPEGTKFCVECGAKFEAKKPIEKPTEPIKETIEKPKPPKEPKIAAIPPPPPPTTSKPMPPSYAPPLIPKSKLKVIGAVAVVAILIVAVFYVGFMMGTQDGGKDGGGVNKVDITTGDNVPVTSQSVDYSGGTISVTDSSNPLYGLKIDVPEAATSDNIGFSIGYADVTDISGLPEGASVAGKMINIETDGSEIWDKYEVFDKAIEITLPYDPDLISSDELVRFYAYDEESNTLSSAGFLSHDSTGHTISFYTRTFSSFIGIKISMTAYELLGINYAVDTGFRPATDGWYITNYGSYLESGGICMGMVSFAKYYYSNKKASDGVGLYEKYREGDLNEWRDDDTAIQLATRAHTAESDVWDQTWRHEIATQVPTSTDVAISWLHGMIVTGAPQLIGIYQQVANGDWVGGHAIMTYRYTNGRFDIYDPNHPGTAPGTDIRQIPFTYGGGFTRVYSSGTTAAASNFQYNVFLHFGYKAFHPLNAFNQFYTYAENGFEDNTVFPTVTLTDLNSGGSTPIDTDDNDIRDTTENTATISGTITGGQEEVTSTLIFVSNQKFIVPVVAGSFSHEVPLYAGENDLIILATDENTFSSWAGYLRDSIESTASEASLTFTLTWGQDNSDVDLHVLEPTINGTDGRHIYYSNKGYEGSGNPYLDIDNTWGYGPEHYYATEEMTLPNYQGSGDYLYGTYKYRVHYYADHDDDYESTQPITWHVTLRYLAFKDELTDTEYWEEDAWSGSSSTASSSDTGNFENPGASWSSTYTVVYPEPDPDDYGVLPPPQNELPD
jgi:uncharacterized protein YfaP (DUF2135 family)